LNSDADIIGIVEKNPGIKFNEMMRITGLKNGILSYRLRQLEDSGNLKIDRTPGATRYFPLGMNDEEMTIIKHLRQNSSNKIVTMLAEHPDLSFQDVVKMSKMTTSNVSITLSKLITEEIVIAYFKKRTKIYNIKKRNVIQKIMGIYQFDASRKSLSKNASVLTSFFLGWDYLSQRFLIEPPFDFIAWKSIRILNTLLA
jgi:predicted transcriptional regulator